MIVYSTAVLTVIKNKRSEVLVGFTHSLDRLTR